MKLSLGQTMRDSVSGFTGIAIQHVEFQSGNIQYALQRKMGEGDTDMPAAHFVDHHMLDFVDKGVSDRVTPVTDKVLVKLGDRVSDKASSLQGIVIRRITFINGCVYFDVMPERKSTLFDGMPDVAFIEHKRLEVIETKALVMDLPKLTGGINRPGGPSRPVARQAVRRA